MKKNVVVIVGPTAVGKTKLSIELAKRFNGEIINGDSMQVYKGLDIGTAKITPEEMQGVPHYLLDIKQPDEGYSAADFKRAAKHYIEDIHSRGKLPIIVGGSGLYIQAALYDYQFSEQKRSAEVTARLEKELEVNGIEPLYERLKEVDPEQAEKIHPNNHRRVIRAIEIFETTGVAMGEHLKKEKPESPYHPIFIGLEMDRKLLYERINERVDEMVSKGLLREVAGLYEKGLQESQSMKAIGYKEFYSFFTGDQSLEETIDLLKRNSRRYAKRQYTWFKNKMDIRWYEVEPDTIDEKFAIIFTDLAGILKK